MTEAIERAKKDSKVTQKAGSKLFLKTMQCIARFHAFSSLPNMNFPLNLLSSFLATTNRFHMLKWLH
jgi:hypothetical protein